MRKMAMTKLTLLEFLTFDAVCAKIEQSSHALEIMDRGTAVGRTPAGLPTSGTTAICDRMYRTWGGYLVEDITAKAGCLE